jgi:hypothetical protein
MSHSPFLPLIMLIIAYEYSVNFRCPLPLILNIPVSFLLLIMLYIVVAYECSVFCPRPYEYVIKTIPQYPALSYEMSHSPFLLLIMLKSYQCSVNLRCSFLWNVPLSLSMRDHATFLLVFREFTMQPTSTHSLSYEMYQSLFLLLIMLYVVLCTLRVFREFSRRPYEKVNKTFPPSGAPFPFCLREWRK